jgi:hypothetical protein
MEKSLEEQRARYEQMAKQAIEDGLRNLEDVPNTEVIIVLSLCIKQLADSEFGDNRKAAKVFLTALFEPILKSYELNTNIRSNGGDPK